MHTDRDRDVERYQIPDSNQLNFNLTTNVAPLKLPRRPFRSGISRAASAPTTSAASIPITHPSGRCRRWRDPFARASRQEHLRRNPGPQVRAFGKSLYLSSSPSLSPIPSSPSPSPPFFTVDGCDGRGASAYENGTIVVPVCSLFPQEDFLRDPNSFHFLFQKAVNQTNMMMQLVNMPVQIAGESFCLSFFLSCSLYMSACLVYMSSWLLLYPCTRTHKHVHTYIYTPYLFLPITSFCFLPGFYSTYGLDYDDIDPIGADIILTTYLMNKQTMPLGMCSAFVGIATRCVFPSIHRYICLLYHYIYHITSYYAYAHIYRLTLLCHARARAQQHRGLYIDAVAVSQR